MHPAIFVLGWAVKSFFPSELEARQGHFELLILADSWSGWEQRLSCLKLNQLYQIGLGAKLSMYLKY